MSAGDRSRPVPESGSRGACFHFLSCFIWGRAVCPLWPPDSTSLQQQSIVPSVPMFAYSESENSIFTMRPRPLRLVGLGAAAAFWQVVRRGFPQYTQVKAIHAGINCLGAGDDRPAA